MKTTKKIISSVFVLLLISSCQLQKNPVSNSEGLWIDSWASSHLSTTVTRFEVETQATIPAQFSDQTLRLIIWNQLAGEKIRIRFSNAFGKKPLVIGAAHIALPDQSPGSIKPDTNRQLTFDNKAGVTLEPGEEKWSDPVNFSVVPLTNLSISIYLPETFTPDQFHPTALKTSFVFSAKGDQTSASDLDPLATKTSMLFFINNLQIKAEGKKSAPKVLVTLGDSITDGAVSDIDTETNWPGYLAKRLAQEQKPDRISVINMGIGSNRFCASEGAGPSGLTRLQKDVFARENVRWVILLEGINDISYEHISAKNLIDCYKSAISQLRARNIKVYQSPLLPIKHSVKDTPENEATRMQVNQWIRNTSAKEGGPDAVIDFESAVWDPNDRAQILPQYTSDHVHPNSSGYISMAKAIDLNLFKD
jgi:lysophospholipase L1-like esterase